MFFTFVPLLEGTPSPSSWIKGRASQLGVLYLVQHFEKLGSDYPLAEAEQRVPIIQWFSLIEVMLDGYHWIFSQSLFPASQIVANSATCLWQAIRYLVEHILPISFSTSTSLSPMQLSEYNARKCTVIVRVLQLFTTLIHDDIKLIPQDLWSDTFIQFILVCAIDPISYGFDFSNSDVKSNLPRLSGSILVSLSDRLPAALKEVLVQEASAMLRMSVYSLQDVAEGIKHSSATTAAMLPLISGYEQLHSARILDLALSASNFSVRQLSDSLLGTLLDRCTNAILSPEHDAVAARLLELSFELYMPIDRLMDCLLDANPLVTHSNEIMEFARLAAGNSRSLGKDDDDDDRDVAQLSATRGSVFFRAHSDQISQYISRHFVHFAKPIISNLSDPTIKLVLRGVLQASKDTPALHKYQHELVAAFIVNSPIIYTWWKPPRKTFESHSEAVNLLQSLLSFEVPSKYSFELPEARALVDMYLEYIQDPTISLPDKGLNARHTRFHLLQFSVLLF